MDNEEEYKSYVFDFEKLNVYQLAISFNTEAINTVKSLPTALRFSLGNNFVRAAISVVSNIAEGSGKKSKSEKKLFYGYALTSARECIPTITILHQQKCIDEIAKDSLRAQCIKICNMLGKLIGSVERQ